MQFNDSSTSQGLIQDITFLLGNGIDTNNYSLADRTRNINVHYAEVWFWIFEAYGGWKFMDDNVSDATTGVPYADQTITSGTGLYVLPSASLTIDGVFFITSAGSTAWHKLTPLTHEQFMDMGADAAFPATGTPEYYLLQGDIARLLPTPNFTLASALRIFFDQGMSNFVSSDTTKVPGFASIFHRALSVGAALDYAAGHGMADKTTELQKLLYDNPSRTNTMSYEHKIKAFYAKRFRERFPHNLGQGPDLVDEFS